jgi:ABC-type transport system involved in cytochrome c biogenesis permease component
MLAFMSEQNMGVFAKQMFYSVLSSVVGIYALFAGIRNTSDNISVEKREGTLGLLFLTDLKGYDVILGKLCSAAIHSLYGMIAAFPVLGVALIGGGITGSEFLRGSLALVNVVFFAHAAGLAVSAYSLNGRRALGAGMLIAFMIMWGLPILVSLLAFARWTETSHWLGMLSPLNALQMGLSPAGFNARSMMFGGAGIRFASSTFWPSLVVSHLFGWAFLIAACWHVPRCWQNVDVRTSVRNRLQQMWHGSTEARTNFRRRLVSINPFFWLASRTRFDPVLTVVYLLGAMAVILWFFFKVGIDVVALAITVMVVLHLILRVSIASSASRHFAEQRRSGALEFLLGCTPLDTKDLIHGQWLALRRQFLLPLIAVLSIDGMCVVLASMTDFRSSGSGTGTEFYVFSVAMVFMLIADSIALGWVGMWMGISANKPNRASGAALGRVMLWPCVGALFIASRLGIGNHGGYGLLALWFLVGVIFDAFLITHARKSLYAKFRILAGTPYGEQSGVLAAIGRAMGNAVKPHASANRGEVPPVIG